jgi:succinyl-diaminopimelate desuccinylase
MTEQHSGISDIVELLETLIRCQSVTPVDAGCQDILAEQLETLGFSCESMPFGEVSNLWARRGQAAPLLCFAGHTDVVPPGPLENWRSDPFEPVIRDGTLYGRGAADMKGSIAAFMSALQRFLQRHPDHKGSIALLITSDEEGPARDGTLKVIETLAQRNESIDWCIVGEPSSQSHIGDVVRIGRRGSLSGLLVVNGVQGHVAYPHLADNPIRRFAPVLSELHETQWDSGNAHFPPTSFQVVDLASRSAAVNVIPGSLSARFNFRYSTEWTHTSLKERVHAVFDQHDIDYELSWHLSGEPFLTSPGRLTEAASKVVAEATGTVPDLSTGGGTSDGRFISPSGADVIELGPVNASIHKVDEHVSIADLGVLSLMYERLIEEMLT